MNGSEDLGSLIEPRELWKENYIPGKKIKGIGHLVKVWLLNSLVCWIAIVENVENVENLVKVCEVGVILRFAELEVMLRVGRILCQVGALEFSPTAPRVFGRLVRTWPNCESLEATSTILL